MSSSVADPIPASDHAGYMRLALALAEQAPRRPDNFRVGALLVDPARNAVLATGYTRELPGNRHAEECALAKLAAAATAVRRRRLNTDVGDAEQQEVELRKEKQRQRQQKQQPQERQGDERRVAEGEQQQQQQQQPQQKQHEGEEEEEEQHVDQGRRQEEQAIKAKLAEKEKEQGGGDDAEDANDNDDDDIDNMFIPPGTVLYTTLEPCVRRLSGRMSCVERILRTRQQPPQQDGRDEGPKDDGGKGGGGAGEEEKEGKTHATTTAAAAAPGIAAVYVGLREPDTFAPGNDGFARLRAAGIACEMVPGLEDEIRRVATAGHQLPLE